VPELSLCPAEFDFPRPPRAARVSVESVDLERSERPFDWSRIRDDRPLLYCALGGQRYRPRDVPAFLARLVGALRARPAWQLVLALGKHAATQALGAVPSNVIVVDSAPQLALLRRAQVMITHAGLGSVKECILHGVPMLAVPLDVDQPANAARILFHGLGLRADVRESGEGELLDKLGRLLGVEARGSAREQNNEEGFRERVVAMRERFLRIEQAGRGVAWVERWLAAGAAPGCG
jgi:MGT family glycosyltransferase